MLGSALIASQGFGPDSLPEETASIAECETLADDHAREDCLSLRAN
jgi:hypothetical protein